jgi:hypothetical protein
MSAGCTVVNANRFRMIDASDGRPIAGVRAKGVTNIPTSVFFTYDRTPEFATSDSEGLVEFRGIGENEVTFEKVGYEPCAVVASSSGYYVPRGSLVIRQTFPWEDDRTPVIRLQPCKRE